MLDCLRAKGIEGPLRHRSTELDPKLEPARFLRTLDAKELRPRSLTASQPRSLCPLSSFLVHLRPRLRPILNSMHHYYATAGWAAQQNAVQLKLC